MPFLPDPTQDEAENQSGGPNAAGQAIDPNTPIEDFSRPRILQFWHRDKARISLKGLSYTLTVFIFVFIIAISLLIARGFNNLAKQAEEAQNINIPQALGLYEQTLQSDRLLLIAQQMAKQPNKELRDAQMARIRYRLEKFIDSESTVDSDGNEIIVRSTTKFSYILYLLELLTERLDSLQTRREFLASEVRQSASSLIDVNLFVDDLMNDDSQIIRNFVRQRSKQAANFKELIAIARLQKIFAELHGELVTLPAADRFDYVTDAESYYRGLVKAGDSLLRQIAPSRQQLLSNTLDDFQINTKLFDYRLKTLAIQYNINRLLKDIEVELKSAAKELSGGAALLAGNSIDSIAINARQSLTTALIAFVILGGVFIVTGLAVQHEIVKPTLRASNALVTLSQQGQGIRLAYSDLIEIEAINKGVMQLAAALKEKEEANQRLVEMAQMKTNLTSSVSHELRTPLTSIRGFVSLTSKLFATHFVPLAETPKLKRQANKVATNLDIVSKESRRLGQLIDDLLDIAKIESGRMVWRDQETDLKELVKNTSNAISGEFAMKPSVKFVKDVADGLPSLFLDQDRMQQVLMNLLNNAVKFTDHGTIILRISQRLPGYVMIDIIDSGMGIPADDLDIIFQKFQQTSKQENLQDKPKGTGLGLAICRQIVEHYGGKVMVESTVGEGSTFSISLPIAADAERREQASAGSLNS